MHAEEINNISGDVDVFPWDALIAVKRVEKMHRRNKIFSYLKDFSLMSSNVFRLNHSTYFGMDSALG